MNVLLITTDQQRADTLGAYGSRLGATPNLDRLAAEGTRFDRCRTQNPYCQPSRATILTGRYPSRHGVYLNGVDLPQEDVGTTLSALLGAAGWTTAFRGKAHFASTYPRTPTGALESVEGSAAMPEGWGGPYMGFGDVDLILFGHHINPGADRPPERASKTSASSDSGPRGERSTVARAAASSRSQARPRRARRSCTSRDS